MEKRMSIDELIRKYRQDYPYSLNSGFNEAMKEAYELGKRDGRDIELKRQWIAGHQDN